MSYCCIMTHILSQSHIHIKYNAIRVALLKRIYIQCNEAKLYAMHRESTGPVPYFKGGCHISPGKGGSQEKESFWKSGEGAKGGEDGAMDGNIERAWVGKERQMPYQDLV